MNLGENCCDPLCSATVRYRIRSKEITMKRSRTRHYEDFVIGTPSGLFYLMRPLVWVWAQFGKSKRAKYYGTSIRRVGKSKIEVTFDLPPTVKQQMARAIKAGKAIRLFVL